MIKNSANFHWGVSTDEKKEDKKGKKKDHKAILDSRKAKGKKGAKGEESKQALLENDLKETSKNNDKFNSAHSAKENQTVEDFVALKNLDL